MGAFVRRIHGTVSRGDGSPVSDAPFTITTHSPEETEQVGRALAELLRESGGVVAMRGELASGKTCLVRGMVSAFTDPACVHSPTFTLINEYGDTPTIYHMDLYRMSGPVEVEDIGCLELFESNHICAIEWAERAEPLLPNTRLDVHLEHGGEDTRNLRFENRGLLIGDWAAALR